MKYKIIIDKNRPYESACEILGQAPVTLDQFSFLPEDDRQYMLSMHRITTVIKAQKQGRKFDWNSYEQGKYYPWCNMETYEGQTPGSGFSFHVCDYTRTTTCVGARLSSFSVDEVRFIVEAMPDDYKVIMKEE